VDVFDLRNRVIADYGDYVRSFLTIKDERIDALVHQELNGGLLWPEPLVQLNPAFEPGTPIADLVSQGALHSESRSIFCDKPDPGTNNGPLRLHQHQVESIHAANDGENYVLTTGTGSGQSLAYIVPIVDHVLRRGSGKGIQAIIVYPMNALANSQQGELKKFLEHGYPAGHPPVTYRRYTGQESEEERSEIIANPPDILLTNYVMLELVLTRPRESKLVKAAKGLRFLVLDELHTYRGRQGADVAMLVRRLRQACDAKELLHVGTSATLAGGGTWEEQQREVAEVASHLFGDEVKPARIIGETLRRVTPPANLEEPTYLAALQDRLTGAASLPATTTDFLADPLASWIESNLGLMTEAETGRLVRCRPIPLAGEEGAAARLASQTGVPAAQCGTALRETLLAGHQLHDEHGHPVFAFRLHQFISKGESVYVSPEAEDVRHVTVQPQQYVPGSNRQKVLLPIAFCRECGQEYYVVRRSLDDEGRTIYIPREINDHIENDDGDPGFLYINTTTPWPSAGPELIDRLPDSWLEHRDGTPRVRADRKKRLPKPITLSPAGAEGVGNFQAHYFDTPFLFCLHCGVTYTPRQKSDFGKLATLGSEGRSTATTVLSLSTIRKLRNDPTLRPEARKLLSFTDNRQDASLQAGHFNDFVEIGLLRSALCDAVERAGEEGIRHDQLTRKVFEALGLPLELYAANPEVEYLQREETDKALRRALGYYLYRDLRRGWRVTSPNLEQSGLLTIDYLSLAEVCRDEPKWATRHPLLADADPPERERVCRVLLDYLRRELAIRVDYLEPIEQESIQQLSSQYLIPPWAMDEAEQPERSRVVFPRPGSQQDRSGGLTIALSPRGGFGLYLKQANTFPGFQDKLKTDDIQQVIVHLLEILTIPGLVHRVMEPRNEEDVPGYQLNASAMVWKAGDGEHAFHDPVKVPNAPAEGHRTNPFFVDFYRSDTHDLKRVEAREHTAQVPAKMRQEREDSFRHAHLPILYCSPTMELGVDIAQLNVVNMRNVPPTPANYAQRSGRAGRSGQPAFVFTYCAVGSPHDQYFFKRQEQMVAGAVAPPRLDLANEDMLRAHVQAIWLANVGLDLRSSLADILDVNGENPTLELLPDVRTAVQDSAARERTRHHAREALGSAIDALVQPDGSVDEWLQRVLDQIPHTFEEACDRWRSLHQAALSQMQRQHRIIQDAARDPRDRKYAKRLWAEAVSQRELLLESKSWVHSDFYSYRYFASEGFLPGYNFPRLPLSAYIPGRRHREGRDEFLSRPRFLAISEYGPRAIVYHEGSRYVINKVILPVESEETGLTRRAVQCDTCGYLHPLGDDPSPDLCERCGSQLPPPMDNLFRMQNVATRRRDRINSDEEERLRLGYEIKTGIRFALRDGVPWERRATLTGPDGAPLASLIYGHAATLWRINLGWRRRVNKDQTGYMLDVERGFWARNKAVADDPEDPESPRQERVIPYVEDRRNCVLVTPATDLDAGQMASLQAALKAALQAHFQLEDNELSAEPLPDEDNRHTILLYEAAEGGAGVLRRLVEDPATLSEVARVALDLCHFDPDTGHDRGKAARAKEECEAACYDCLLSYYNQRDHRRIDRKRIAALLSAWMGGTVATSPAPRPREEQVERLMRLTDSGLERRWIQLVDRLGLRLPSTSQKNIDDCYVRPDFLYEHEGVAVFIDGPPHDTPGQQAKDTEQTECLEDLGYHVLRFHHQHDWEEILRANPTIFGAPTQEAGGGDPSSLRKS